MWHVYNVLYLWRKSQSRKYAKKKRHLLINDKWLNGSLLSPKTQQIRRYSRLLIGSKYFRSVTLAEEVNRTYKSRRNTLRHEKHTIAETSDFIVCHLLFFRTRLLRIVAPSKETAETFQTKVRISTKKNNARLFTVLTKFD